MRSAWRRRLLAGMASVGAVLVIAWLAAAGLAWTESRDAVNLRIAIGVEAPPTHCEVNGSYGPSGPTCTFSAEEQRDYEEQWARHEAVRVAVAEEISLRIHARLDVLAAVEARVGEFASGHADQPWYPKTSYGGDLKLRDLHQAQPTLTPFDRLPQLDHRPFFPNWDRVISAFEPDDGVGRHAWTVDHEMQALREAVAAERWYLHEVLTHTAALRGIERPRLANGELATAQLAVPDTVAHNEIQLAVRDAGRDVPRAFAAWIDASNLDHGSIALLLELERDPNGLWGAILEPINGPVQWAGIGPINAALEGVEDLQIAVPQRQLERYTATMGTFDVAALGSVFVLGFAALLLLVAGPAATLAQTAREREAGTLPVLRMTGMSARDLALAMALGPNVATHAAGLSALLLGLGLAGLGQHMTLFEATIAIAVVIGLSVATHLIAIALGDALAQRFNATTAAGLFVAALLSVGGFGAALSWTGLLTSGLYLGPLPAAGVVLLSALPTVDNTSAVWANPDMAAAMTSALAATAVLAYVALRSWCRRVEQPWAPHLSPAEGLGLGLMSVLLGGLALADAIASLGVVDPHALNFITFLVGGIAATPMVTFIALGLRRAPRARAIPSVTEIRRAFLRFQIGLVALAGVLGVVYVTGGVDVLIAPGMEPMVSTLAQVVLVMKTSIATLLWATRRAERRSGAVIIGGSLVILQLLAVAVVYVQEAMFVSTFDSAVLPWTLAASISPYWLAFLALLWIAGLAVIVASLLGESAARERRDAERERGQSDEGDEAADDLPPGGRWIH